VAFVRLLRVFGVSSVAAFAVRLIVAPPRGVLAIFHPRAAPPARGLLSARSAAAAAAAAKTQKKNLGF
jgi:hypothetical protein